MDTPETSVSGTNGTLATWAQIYTEALDDMCYKRYSDEYILGIIWTRIKQLALSKAQEGDLEAMMYARKILKKLFDSCEGRAQSYGRSTNNAAICWQAAEKVKELINELLNTTYASVRNGRI